MDSTSFLSGVAKLIPVNCINLRWLVSGVAVLQLILSQGLAFAQRTDFAKYAERRGEVDKPVPVDPKLVSRFVSREFIYADGLDYHDDMGPYRQEMFRYRLHEPEIIEPGKVYPLIVWLHGCGDERGWDNTSQLQYLEKTAFPTDAGPELRQFYVLAPQSPLIPGAPGVWHSHSADPATRTAAGQEDDMLTVVMAILDKTLAENPVDPDRVTLVGISCAANACLELGVRYPNRWAALTPLSPGQIPEKHIKVLPTCPIWMFTNYKDEFMSLDTYLLLDQSIARANLMGCDIAHTALDQDEWKHDSWTPAFQQYDLLTWLLAQHRGKFRWMYPPGIETSKWPWRQPLRNWSSFQLLTQLAVVVAISITPLYIWQRRAFLADILQIQGRRQ
jgi:predicted esterase